MKQIKYLFIIACCAVLISACGGGGGGGDGDSNSVAPTISNLQYSPHIVLTGSGNIEINGIFDFENKDADAFSLRFVDSLGTDSTSAIDGTEGVTSGKIPARGTLDTSTIGTYTFTIWLVDAAGNTSNRLSGDIVITNGDTPTISNLQYSPHSVLAGSGDVAIDIDVDFVDTDANVFSLKLTDSLGGDYNFNLTGNEGISSGQLSVQATLDTSTIGTYTFTIWLVDAAGNTSNRLSGDIVITNGEPVANAGSAYIVGTTGSDVFLDGNGSSDPNGDVITYEWSFIEKPVNSNSVILDALLAVARFVPDVDGTYKFQLVVNDGLIDSDSSTTIISSIPGGYFTLGSTKADIASKYGDPDYTIWDGDLWVYQDRLPITTTVTFSSTDETVRAWQDAGGMFAKIIVPGNNITNETTFTYGSNKDDVARLEGTPYGIDLENSYTIWKYYYSCSGYESPCATVRISEDGTVLGWDDSRGLLHVR